MNSTINLHDFLLYKTAVHELCVLLDHGYPVSTCYIDSEDLFISGVAKKFLECTVQKDYKGVLNTAEGAIIVHYIEIGRS